MPTMPHFFVASFGPLLQRFTDAARQTSSSDVAATVIGTSFVCYLILKRYEPKEHFFTSISIFLLCVPALLAFALHTVLKSFPRAVLVAYITHWALLLFFTSAYRLSPFHPLAGYPGPLLARLTKWWTAYQVARYGQMHLVYQRLHERYGDYVRVGPNELSVRDGGAVHTVLGTTGLPKGPYYSNRTIPPTLVSERSPAAHAERRKPWNRGFTTPAVKDYELIVSRRLMQLTARIEQKIAQGVNEMTGRPSKGAVLNMAKWISFFTTDFMGDMAFGGGFELLENECDKQGIWEIMEGGIVGISMLSHVPWVLKLPFVVSRMKASIEISRALGRKKVSERLKLGASRKDLFYHLADEEGTGRIRPSDAALASDGFIAIVAGSDTTATTLTGILCNLVKNPQAYERLQREIDAAFPRGELPLDATKQAGMEYLNACISETLRLFPAVPSGSPRWVPPGGGPKVLGTHIIPEGTQIMMHTYSIHRDPRYFSPSPEAFIPERWLEPAELARLGVDVSKTLPPGSTVHDVGAYFPFSFGPANCVGKNLAWMEMRMVVCQLLHLFRFSRIEGGRVDEWERDLQDYFIFRKPDVFLRVERR